MTVGNNVTNWNVTASWNNVSTKWLVELKPNVTFQDSRLKPSVKSTTSHCIQFLSMI